MLNNEKTIAQNTCDEKDTHIYWNITQNAAYHSTLPVLFFPSQPSSMYDYLASLCSFRMHLMV